MRGRGDSEDNIKIRAERFAMEMQASKDCDYMVSNDVIRDTTDEVNCLLQNEELLGGLYRPSKIAGIPEEKKIVSEMHLLEQGTVPDAVELGFNGRELLIVDGTARYAAARRLNIFIQKKIKTLTNPTLNSAEISLQDWEKRISLAAGR